MFKLAVAILVGLAAQSFFADAAVDQLLSGFLSENEIELIFDSTTEGSAKNAHRAARWTAGKIPAMLVDRLAEQSPYNHRRWLRSSDDTEALEPSFQIKTMKETTSVHVDEYSDKCYTQYGPQKASTFVFLNSNEDAYFVHDGQSVPVTAGTLVNFQADKPHQTVVNNGIVQMLVPFANRRLMPPSGECDNDGNVFGNGNPDLEGTDCCNCDEECPSERPICATTDGSSITPGCYNYYAWNSQVCCPNWDASLPTDENYNRCAADGVCSFEVYPGSNGFCMTPAGNIYSPTELLAQECDCDGFPNHGQYVKCVVHAINDGAYDSYEFTQEQLQELRTTAAQSDCSKKK
ncbi:hypothetical protein IV203_010931 [Nitzschia inconspicua]|uniref:Uncharacterized protein n=1 Tax=Nitzschia inconspicua TaxID=303405 RepID=A0A9K3PE43_9STRA|nr:hypothetical protein IV203_023712 [Nitzschia inconspicua]KAG7351571.1 hypothetical protein IV203_010931 [Nitzschia inconspicua]